MITNYEVLQCVRGYALYRSKTATNEDPAKVKLESDVRTYLNSTRIKTVTRPQIEELKRKLEPFGFSKAETLQILNILPMSLVELYLLVKEIEVNFTEEQMQEVLQLIQTTCQLQEQPSVP